MKRLTAILTSIVLFVAMAMPAFATVYRPSVEAKSAPEIVPVAVEEETGKIIIGHVVDENGEICTTEYDECIIVTAMSDVKDSEHISDTAKAAMEEFHTGLVNGDISFEEDCPELIELIKEKFGESFGAHNIVVKDLFEVTILCESFNEQLMREGTTVSLNFDLNLPAGVEVFAVTYKNNEIVLAKDVVNNGDGTVTATFESFCPVAFLVIDETIEEVVAEGAACAICNGKFVFKASPIPSVCLTCFMIIAAVIVVGIGSVCVFMKKGKTKK